jgi:eukaryotic-like serine/threonine-protein kinase
MVAGAGNIDELPAGFLFGNYAIRELIGRGGMARVYRAEHVALNKLVALKVMDGALQDKSAGHRRFLREGQAAAAVKHPNVVDITDVGIWEGLPYLVMELLQGQDLESYLQQRGPLHDAELARLALPIIAGLAVLHDAGVVHRDLKPSNIFLARGPDGDVVPKVLDFGISKVARKTLAPELLATPFGEVMGTPLYMPPEALDGTRDLTPRSDQYSLGVVLYECVAGRPPFRADSLVALLNLIAAGQFEPPSKLRPDISASVERAILRAMRFSQADRFEHVRDFGRALWELASPRTQLLWARSFDVRVDDHAQGSSLLVAGRSDESATLQSNAPRPARDHPYAVTRRIPSSRQHRRRRLAVAFASSAGLATVLGLAIAYSLREAPTPLATTVVAPPQPSRPSEAINAGLSSTQAAPSREVVAPPVQHRRSSAEPEPGKSANKEATARREPRSKAPDDARPIPARSQKRTTGEAAAVSSPVSRAPPARRPEDASEEEFPGISRAESGSAGARQSQPRAPEGANESPILD